MTPSGQRSGKLAGAAAEIENRAGIARKLHTELEVRASLVLEVVELDQRGVVIEAVRVGVRHFLP